MAKGSGGTRTKRSSGISNAQMQNFVQDISKDGSIDYDKWITLSGTQQISLLQNAKFTGAISDDLWNGVLYMPTTQKEMVATFQDDLVNHMQGNKIEDTTYTVLYKDGTTKELSSIANDFDNVNITERMGKQAYTNAKNALNIKNVAAIIKTTADSQPSYSLAKGGEQAMRDYGFEFWKDGRGEKK